MENNLILCLECEEGIIEVGGEVLFCSYCRATEGLTKEVTVEEYEELQDLKYKARIETLKKGEVPNEYSDFVIPHHIIINTENEDLEWKSVSEDVDKGLNTRMIIGIIIGLIILTLAALTSYGQTKKEVYNYIKATDIKHPEIVYAQAMLETGNLDTTKSKIYKENHNLFGMKEPKTRLTYATGTNRKHATYNSWRWCILDYSIWQKTYYKGGDYYQFLKSVGYAMSKTYIEKLREF